MARYAVAVKYWLYLKVECERAHTTLWGLQLCWCFARCHSTLCYRHRVLILVTSHTRKHLARHTRNPATHPLYGTSFAVQRLERYGCVGRYLEHSRAVGLHIHLAEVSLNIPTTLNALRDVVRLRIHIGIFVGKDTQFLHLAHGHTLKTFALVDVLNKYCSLLILRLYAVGDDGRCRAFVHDDWVYQTLTLILRHKGHIVVNVNKIYSPQRLWRQLGCNEEIFVVDRIWLDELWPYAIYQLILYKGYNLALREWHLLNHSLGLLASLRGVKQYESSRAGNAVVTRDDTHKGVHTPWQRLHVEDRVWEPATTTIECLGLGAVGVGVHHKA